MFILKKMITVLILPLNLCLLLLISGLLTVRFTHKQKAGKVLITAGICLLLLFSLPPFARVLVGSLESQYSPLSTESISKSNIQWIVVLGGGHNSTLPKGVQLSPSSLARVTEGIRLYRSKPGMKLIFSGGAVFDPVPNAIAMSETARIFGVSEKDMVLETRSMDTEDEAKFLAPKLKGEGFYLVTSAFHMKRSLAIFVKQGMNPIPAPTDFSFYSTSAPFVLRVLPSSSAFTQSEKSLREHIGITWSRLRGKA